MDVSPTIQHLHGRIRSITGTDPAAGAEISETVPARRRWRLLAIDFNLTTDATVANRFSRLYFDDGTTVFYTIEAPAAQTASLLQAHSFAIGGQTSPIISDTFNSPLPDIFLPAGSRIQTSTKNKEAGDNYDAPQLLVEEWIDP